MRIDIIRNKKQKKDYSQEYLENIWVKNNDDNKRDANNNLYKEFIDKLSVRDSVICLYIQDIKEIANAIQHANERNNRIYVLTKPNQDDILQDLSKHCLIRTIDNIYCNFMLIKSDKSGLFFPNHYFSLTLNKNQFEELYNFYIYSFWRVSNVEYIYGKKETILKNDQKDFMKPHKDGFDHSLNNKLIDENYDNSVLGLYSECNLLKNMRNCKIYLINKDKITDSMLNKNNKLYVADINFDFIMHDEIQNKNYIRIQMNNYEIWNASLDSKQIEELRQYINSIYKEYEFYNKVMLSEIRDKTIYHCNDNQEHEIKSNEKYNDKIECDKLETQEELEKRELDFDKIWDEKYKKHVCEIEFEWNIIPYFTPDGYKEDTLYKEWNDAKNKLEKKVEEMIKNIDDMQNKKEKLNNFKAIVSHFKDGFIRFFLGKNIEINVIKKELDEFKQKLEKQLDKETYKKYTEELNKYEERLNKNENEIDNKLQEAEEHNKWQQKKDELEQQIEKIEKECERINSEIKKFNEEKAKNEEKLNLIEQKISDNEKLIDELKKKLDKKEDKSTNAKKEPNNDEIKNLNIKCEETKKILDDNKKNKDELEKDIQTKEIRIKQEDRKLSEKKEELESKKKELEKKYTKFEYKHKENNGNKSPLEYLYGKDKGNELYLKHLKIPNENLPNVGILKSNSKGERLLEIESYKELKKAQEDAKILNAKLSAKPISHKE